MHKWRTMQCWKKPFAAFCNRMEGLSRTMPCRRMSKKEPRLFLCRSVVEAMVVPGNAIGIK